MVHMEKKKKKEVWSQGLTVGAEISFGLLPRGPGGGVSLAPAQPAKAFLLYTPLPPSWVCIGEGRRLPARPPGLQPSLTLHPSGPRFPHLRGGAISSHTGASVSIK